MSHRNEIENELLEVAPLLGRLEHKPLYKVADEYFQALPSTILRSAQNRISASAKPSVPDNYFEDLPRRILKKINTRKMPLGQTSVKWFEKKSVLAAAASIALIAVIAAYLLFQQQNNEPELLASQTKLTTEEIQQYLASNIYLIDEESVIQLLEESEANPAAGQANQTQPPAEGQNEASEIHSVIMNETENIDPDLYNEVF
jgi:hypothetical protein